METCGIGICVQWDIHTNPKAPHDLSRGPRIFFLFFLQIMDPSYNIPCADPKAKLIGGRPKQVYEAWFKIATAMQVEGPNIYINYEALSNPSLG